MIFLHCLEKYDWIILLRYSNFKKFNTKNDDKNFPWTIKIMREMWFNEPDFKKIYTFFIIILVCLCNKFSKFHFLNFFCSSDQSLWKGQFCRQLWRQLSKLAPQVYYWQKRFQVAKFDGRFAEAGMWLFFFNKLGHHSSEIRGLCST